MQHALDRDSVGNVFDLRVPPGRRDIDGHRFLDSVQLFCPLAAIIMDQFDQKGTMDKVFAERLAVGFSVDHIHSSRRPFVVLHNIFSYRWSQGFSSWTVRRYLDVTVWPWQCSWAALHGSWGTADALWCEVELYSLERVSARTFNWDSTSRSLKVAASS